MLNKIGKSRIFKGWRVTEVISPESIPSITLNGVEGIKVSPSEFFSNYVEYQLYDGSNYVPRIEGEDHNKSFNLHFFPTFCVVEFKPSTRDTSFIVLTPPTSDPVKADIAAYSLKSSHNDGALMQEIERLINEPQKGQKNSHESAKPPSSPIKEKHYLLAILTVFLAIILAYFLSLLADSSEETKTYKPLVFSTTSPNSVKEQISEAVVNAEPGEIFYLSVKDDIANGATCGMGSNCDAWEIQLRLCEEEEEPKFNENLHCFPVLLVPTKLDSGKNNVQNCNPSHFELNGFFTFKYLRQHFGQGFHRAYEGVVSPERVESTLKKYGSSSCW